MEHPCLAGRIAHVPRDGLIAFGNGRSLRIFDDENLWASGLMDFSHLLTTVVGGFSHDSWASCVAVGGQQGGVYIVSVKQPAIIKIIDLPAIAEGGYPATNNLENLSLVPWGTSNRSKPFFTFTCR